LAGRRDGTGLGPPRLLGAFDPLLLGWTSREPFLGSLAGLVTVNGLFRPFALVRGRAAATWSLTGKRIVLEPFAPLSSDDAAALDLDAADVVRFLADTSEVASADETARMEPVFFATPAEFRAWLEAHHEDAPELWVGFYKKGSGRPSITWPEAVDEALCVGWIDGVRKSLDEASYVIRFTPRRPNSVWSAVNVDRVSELTTHGRMRPSGQQAFELRRKDQSGVYSYENRHDAALEEAYDREIRSHSAAWRFFESRPRWYRQAAIRWVMSAKKEQTRRKRLSTLIEDSARGRTVPPLTRPPK
jgi:uncharacterized protein YdeI (YjbR/CyaY-like superfamily)